MNTILDDMLKKHYAEKAREDNYSDALEAFSEETTKKISAEYDRTTGMINEYADRTKANVNLGSGVFVKQDENGDIKYDTEPSKLTSIDERISNLDKQNSFYGNQQELATINSYKARVQNDIDELLTLKEKASNDDNIDSDAIDNSISLLQKEAVRPTGFYSEQMAIPKEDEARGNRDYIKAAQIVRGAIAKIQMDNTEDDGFVGEIVDAGKASARHLLGQSLAGLAKSVEDIGAEALSSGPTYQDYSAFTKSLQNWRDDSNAVAGYKGHSTEIASKHIDNFLAKWFKDEDTDILGGAKELFKAGAAFPEFLAHSAADIVAYIAAGIASYGVGFGIMAIKALGAGQERVDKWEDETGVDMPIGHKSIVLTASLANEYLQKGALEFVFEKGMYELVAGGKAIFRLDKPTIQAYDNLTGLIALRAFSGALKTAEGAVAEGFAEGIDGVVDTLSTKYRNEEGDMIDILGKHKWELYNQIVTGGILGAAMKAPKAMKDTREVFNEEVSYKKALATAMATGKNTYKKTTETELELKDNLQSEVDLAESYKKGEFKAVEDGDKALRETGDKALANSIKRRAIEELKDERASIYGTSDLSDIIRSDDKYYLGSLKEMGLTLGEKALASSETTLEKLTKFEKTEAFKKATDEQKTIFAKYKDGVEKARKFFPLYKQKITDIVNSDESIQKKIMSSFLDNFNRTKYKKDRNIEVQRIAEENSVGLKDKFTEKIYKDKETVTSIKNFFEKFTKVEEFIEKEFAESIDLLAKAHANKNKDDENKDDIATIKASIVIVGIDNLENKKALKLIDMITKSTDVEIRRLMDKVPDRVYKVVKERISDMVKAELDNNKDEDTVHGSSSNDDGSFGYIDPDDIKMMQNIIKNGSLEDVQKVFLGGIIEKLKKASETNNVTERIKLVKQVSKSMAAVSDEILTGEFKDGDSKKSIVSYTRDLDNAKTKEDISEVIKEFSTFVRSRYNKNLAGVGYERGSASLIEMVTFENIALQAMAKKIMKKFNEAEAKNATFVMNNADANLLNDFIDKTEDELNGDEMQNTEVPKNARRPKSKKNIKPNKQLEKAKSIATFIRNIAYGQLEKNADKKGLYIGSYTKEDKNGRNIEHLVYAYSDGKDYFITEIPVYLNDKNEKKIQPSHFQQNKLNSVSAIYTLTRIAQKKYPEKKGTLIFSINEDSKNAYGIKLEQDTTMSVHSYSIGKEKTLLEDTFDIKIEDMFDKSFQEVHDELIEIVPLNKKKNKKTFTTTSESNPLNNNGESSSNQDKNNISSKNGSKSTEDTRDIDKEKEVMDELEDTSEFEQILTKEDIENQLELEKQIKEKESEIDKKNKQKHLSKSVRKKETKALKEKLKSLRKKVSETIKNKLSEAIIPIFNAMVGKDDISKFIKLHTPSNIYKFYKVALSSKKNLKAYFENHKNILNGKDIDETVEILANKDVMKISSLFDITRILVPQKEEDSILNILGTTVGSRLVLPRVVQEQVKIEVLKILFVAKNFKMQTNDQIANAYGIKNEHEITDPKFLNIINNIRKSGGSPLNVMFPDAGANIMKALGITVSDEAEHGTKARYETELGNLVKALVLSTRDESGKFLVTQKAGPEYQGKTPYFYLPTKDSVLYNIDKIVLQNYVYTTDLLFNKEPSVLEPQYNTTKYVFVPKKQLHSEFEIGNDKQQFLEDRSNIIYHPNSAAELLFNMDRDTAYEAMGFEDKKSMDKMDVLKRAGQVGKNIGIKEKVDKVLDRLPDDRTEMLWGGFKIPYVASKVLRTIQKSVIDLSGNKIHRHLFYGSHMRHEIDFSGDNTGLTIFRLGLAQAFKIGVDKMTDLSALSQLDDTLTIKDGKLDIVDSTLKRIVLALAEDSTDEAALKGAASYSASREQSHTLLAIAELVNIQKAINNGDTKFKSDMTLEYDGITSGMTLALIGLGANVKRDEDGIQIYSVPELLVKGGIYTEEGIEAFLSSIDKNNGENLDIDRLKKFLKLDDGSTNEQVIEATKKHIRKSLKDGSLTHGFLKEYAGLEDYYEDVATKTTIALKELIESIKARRKKLVKKLGAEHRYVLELDEQLALVKEVGDELSRNQAKTGTMSAVYGQGVVSTMRNAFYEVVLPKMYENISELDETKTTKLLIQEKEDIPLFYKDDVETSAMSGNLRLWITDEEEETVGSVETINSLFITNAKKEDVKDFSVDWDGDNPVKINILNEALRRDIEFAVGGENGMKITPKDYAALSKDINIFEASRGNEKIDEASNEMFRRVLLAHLVYNTKANKFIYSKATEAKLEEHSNRTFGRVIWDTVQELYQPIHENRNRLKLLNGILFSNTREIITQSLQKATEENNGVLTEKQYKDVFKKLIEAGVLYSIKSPDPEHKEQLSYYTDEKNPDQNNLIKNKFKSSNGKTVNQSTNANERTMVQNISATSVSSTLQQDSYTIQVVGRDGNVIDVFDAKVYGMDKNSITETQQAYNRETIHVPMNYSASNEHIESIVKQIAYLESIGVDADAILDSQLKFAKENLEISLQKLTSYSGLEYILGKANEDALSLEDTIENIKEIKKNKQKMSEETIVSNHSYASDSLSEKENLSYTEVTNKLDADKKEYGFTILEDTEDTETANENFKNVGQEIRHVVSDEYDKENQHRVTMGLQYISKLFDSFGSNKIPFVNKDLIKLYVSTHFIGLAGGKNSQYSSTAKYESFYESIENDTEAAYRRDIENTKEHGMENKSIVFISTNGGENGYWKNSNIEKINAFIGGTIQNILDDGSSIVLDNETNANTPYNKSGEGETLRRIIEFVESYNNDSTTTEKYVVETVTANQLLEEVDGSNDTFVNVIQEKLKAVAKKPKDLDLENVTYTLIKLENKDLRRQPNTKLKEKDTNGIGTTTDTVSEEQTIPDTASVQASLDSFKSGTQLKTIISSIFQIDKSKLTKDVLDSIKDNIGKRIPIKEYKNNAELFRLAVIGILFPESKEFLDSRAAYLDKQYDTQENEENQIEEPADENTEEKHAGFIAGKDDKSNVFTILETASDSDIVRVVKQVLDADEDAKLVSFPADAKTGKPSGLYIMNEKTKELFVATESNLELLERFRNVFNNESVERHAIDFGNGWSFSSNTTDTESEYISSKQVTRENVRSFVGELIEEDKELDGSFDDDYTADLDMLLEETLDTVFDFTDSVDVQLFETENEPTYGQADTFNNKVRLTGSTRFIGQSRKSVFSHEMFHISTQAALNYDKKIMLRLNRLKMAVYNHMVKNLDNPELIFAKDGSVEQQELSKALFKYIFFDKKANEFFTYALTDPTLFKYIQDNEHEFEVDNRLLRELKLSDGKIKGLFIRMFNFIVRVINKAAEKRLGRNTVGAELIQIKNKAQEMTIKLKRGDTDNIYNTFHKKINKPLATKLRQLKLEFAIKAKQAFPQGMNNLLASAYIRASNSKTQALAKFFVEVNHMIVTDTAYDDRYNTFYDMLNKAKKIQEDDKEHTKSSIVRVLTKQLKAFNKEDRIKLQKLLIETDIMAVTTDSKEIHSLLNDDKHLNTLIKTLENSISDKVTNRRQRRFSKMVMLQAKGLAQFMVHGKTGIKRQMLNTHNISNGLFLNSDELSKIDRIKGININLNKLVSLYALRMAKEENNVNLSKDFRAVNKMLTFFKEMTRDNDRKSFAGSQKVYKQKGYTKMVTDENMEVKVIRLADLDMYVEQGWKFIDYDIKVNDHDDIDMDRVLVTKHDYSAPYSKGVIEITNLRHKGTSMKEFHEDSEHIGTHEIQGMIDDITNEKFDLEADPFTGSEPVPLISIEGKRAKITDYRYTMSTSLKENLLRENKDVVERIAATIVSSSAKITGEESNNMFIEWALNEYKDASDKENFIQISPYNPRTKDQWNKLPEYTKRVLKENGVKEFYIRPELLSDFFGYKNFSFAEAKSSLKRTKPKFYKGLQIVESFLRSLVKLFKPLVAVVNTGVIWGNIKSNYISLVMRGVDPITASKDMVQGFKYLWELRHQLDDIRELEIRKVQGDKVEKELKQLQSLVEDNPLYGLYKKGLISSVVEDVNRDSMTSKNDINKIVDIAMNKSGVRGIKVLHEIIKNMYVTSDTKLFEVLLTLNQAGDASARYSLDKHLRKSGMPAKQSARVVAQAFVMYNTLKAQAFTTMENLSLVLFMQFFLKNMGVVARMLIANPSSVIAYKTLVNTRGVDQFDTYDDNGIVGGFFNRVFGPLDMAETLIVPHITEVY